MNFDHILILTELSALLELPKEQLTDDFVLADNVMWDSLSIVSVIASIQQHYGAVVKGSSLSLCKTIKDIYGEIDQSLGNLKQVV